jgi:hypothetical protein
MPECVYTSTHPDVLAAVRERNFKTQAWNDALKVLGQEAFGEETPFFTFSRERFAGFDHEPVEGWKYGKDKLADCLVPDRRTSIGKKWAKRLEPLRQRPSNPCPGMPGIVEGSHSFGGVTLHYPAWDAVDGVVWCRWGTRPDPSDIDAELWTEAKLSEFYAMMEALGESE